MRRESHRYRGVRRSSRGAGWGHRAVYVASAIAAASLVAGFGLAGYWFGTFSHVYSQATATGFESAPYEVKFLSAAVTSAAYLPDVNYTGVTWNSTTGPCSIPVNASFVGMGVNGTNASANMLNQAGALNPLNLSAGDAYNYTLNGTYNLVCLNAITNGTVTYLWQNYLISNGTLNATGWNNVALAANNITALPQFNVSLADLTGNATQTNNSINVTGCNPVVALNLTDNDTAAELANCPFFVGNNQTTYVPHAGFYWDATDNGTAGTWVNTANGTNETSFWHPNQYGYLPGDQVFYIAMQFGGPAGTLPNMTYEVVISMAGATPIPQAFFVSTGAGGVNETLVFAFDMTAAWYSALPGGYYGYPGANQTLTGGFDSAIYAAVDTFSATVSQCYVDAAGAMACPDSLGGAAFP